MYIGWIVAIVLRDFARHLAMAKSDCIQASQMYNWLQCTRLAMTRHLQMYNWLSVRDFGNDQASSDVQLAKCTRFWQSSDVQLAGLWHPGIHNWKCTIGLTSCTRFWQ